MAPIRKQLTKKFSYDLLDPRNQIYSQIFTGRIFNLLSYHGYYRPGEGGVGMGESVMTFEIFIHCKF